MLTYFEQKQQQQNNQAKQLYDFAEHTKLQVKIERLPSLKN